MDEHEDNDVAETTKERANDHVATEDSDKARIVESTARDVRIGSVIVETSEERAIDHVASGDCEKTQIVDSAASDAQVGSAVMDISEEAASDRVAGGDCEKTRIVDSAASDVLDGSAVMEITKETANDHVVSGECEKTPIVGSIVSDVEVGSGVVQTYKETASDHVASGDCERTQIVDSTVSDIQIGSSVVTTWKETVSDRVASVDSEKTRTVESTASDIQALVKDATMGSSTERGDAEEGGSCYGEDASVGVMRSERHVAGVSAREVDDDGGGMLRKDGNSCPRESTKVGSDRDTEDLVVGGDAVEGGSCNGANVTVGTMPSDIQVDGVSACDAGYDGGVTLSEDGNSCPGESKEVGSERDTKDLVVGSDEDGDFGSKTNTKSNIEALELRSEGEVEKSSGIAESREEKLVDDCTTITEATDVGVGDDQNMAVDGVVEVSTGEEIQVEPENMAAAAGKEELEGKLRNDYVVRGGYNLTEDLNSSEMRLTKNELHDKRVENGETQASTVSKRAGEGPDKAMEIDDSGEDSTQESETEKVGVLDNGASDPEIDTKVVHSSTMNEDPNVETQVVEEEHVVVENHENHVAVDRTVALTEDEDIANIEGMDSDAFNENFCFSVEELQATVETANGSTENHYDAFADSQSSQEPTLLVVAGGDVATENKIGIDNRVTYNEKAGLQKEKGEIETSSMGIGNNTGLNSTSCLAVVSDEAAEIDDMIQSDPNFEVPLHVTRKDKELKPEESLDKIVEQESGAQSLTIDGRQIYVSNSNSGPEVPEEGDYRLKIEGFNGNKTAINENVADAELVDSHEEQEMVAEEQDTDSEEPKTTEEKQAKQVASLEINTKANEATYQLPPDDEGEFEVSDLVWGKVRSHPWWPGQIFDPSDASEKAMKYQKKDCFLVAYFGDRTFAWNDASLLKPFRSHFSQVEKQSNSETFHNAVNCALEEVSRRVEFGLACSCIPEDIYNKIKHQMVENAGIRQESSIQSGMEKSLSADLFEPGKLVVYMKALAQSPAGGADRLQIVVAKSQLLAFYRLKGYSELPEFQFCGALLENDDTSQIEDEVMADKSAFHEDNVKIYSDQQNVQTQRSSYHKRKHNLKDSLNPKKKERSVTELMDDSWDSIDDEFGSDGKANNKLLSHSLGKKRRGPDSLADESEGRKPISLAKASPVSVPKPSFKIGECIRRVASRMTGSPSMLKSNTQKIDESSDGLVVDGSDVSVQHSDDAEMKSSTVPTEYSSLDELLMQLHLAAQDPLKGYGFLTVIVSFFSDFRNAAIMEQREKVLGKKRQQSTGGSPETFEFEDMNDTYWTDRVIQNGSEEQPPRKSRKRDNQLASGDQDKPLNKSNSRKRNSDGNQSLLAEKPVGYVDENAPAELVMHFPVVDSVPSETRLIKMFKRFGPLKEIETEIDRDTNRARVVFKKSSDAESAYSSATKFNIFGSMLVNYQLNYTITVPFKTEPLVALQGEEDATVFLQF